MLHSFVTVLFIHSFQNVIKSKQQTFNITNEWMQATLLYAALTDA